jgi:hypothetical protein
VALLAALEAGRFDAMPDAQVRALRAQVAPGSINGRQKRCGP